MKRTPVILIVILCAGSGALVHHLTGAAVEDGGRGSAARGDQRAGAGKAGGAPVSGHNATEMAKALQRMTANGSDVDWARLEQSLDAMAPGDYLLVLRALTEEDASYFSGDDRLREALIARAAAADATGLLAFAEEAQEGRYERLFEMVSACLPYAPDAVMGAIERLEKVAENEEQADRYTEALVSNLLEGEDVPAAMQALAAAGYVEGSLAIPEDPFGTGLGPTLELAMVQWAARDRPAALALAEKHPRLLASVLVAWASQDAEAALAWLDASPGRRALAYPDPASMDGLYFAYAITHPVEAERYADQVTDLSHFHQSQANGMAHQPPEAAAAWLRALPESDRAGTTSQLLAQFVTDTPASTAELMGFLKAYPEAWQNINEEGTITSMAAHQPAELAQQVATAPLTEAQRLETLRWVTGAWQERDPAAATSFLQSLPPSEMQGNLLMQNSHLLDNETREAALAYALSLPDPSQRFGAARFILQEMTGTEAVSEEARQWIETVPDASVREALKARADQ